MTCPRCDAARPNLYIQHDQRIVCLVCGYTVEMPTKQQSVESQRVLIQRANDLNKQDRYGK